MNEETTKPARAPVKTFADALAEEDAEKEAKRVKELERVERRAARIEHDKLFVDLGDLRYSIERKYVGRMSPTAVRYRMLDLVKSNGTPLFCRWYDPAKPHYPDGVLWAPLPAGPVARVDTALLSWRCVLDHYYLTSPWGDKPGIVDPLDHLRMDRGGLFYEDLAIRREDACRLFGLDDDELLSRFQPAQAPAQPQEDATEAQDASAPAGADPEPVAPSAVAVEPARDSAPASTPKPVAGTAGTGRPKGITKRVLVNLYKARWPTIESDLGAASTNGLAARAKAGERGWIEARAVHCSLTPA